MKIALTEIFMEDLIGLQHNLQCKCQDMIVLIKEIEPKKVHEQSLPGWRLHKLKSSPFISLSVDMNYRILCKIEGDRIFLHRVVKHSLADSSRINRNDKADAPYTIENLMIKPVDIYYALMSLGLSEKYIAAFKQVNTEEDLLDALCVVDGEIADYALSLYETSGLIIPRTKYILLQNDSDLEAILNKTLKEWEIYLHPSQQYIVNLPVDYRLAVCGSAGTGKTVCAWHRLKFLAQKGEIVGFVAPNKSILKISQQMIESLLKDISTDCYFLVPNTDDELAQLAKFVNHIVIDEGQELTPNWYKTLGKALINEGIGVTIFYDINQLGGNYQTGDTRRYEYRLSMWDEGITSISNCNTMKLFINYRNSREIAEFYTGTLQAALPEPINAEIPIFSCGEVICYVARDIAQTFQMTLETIQKLKSFYENKEIGIICLGGAIKPKEICRRLEYANIPTTMEFEADNKILVTLPRIIRGYEKKAIIVVASSEEYITKDFGKAISSYIALSRARDRLFVIKLGD
ncbi:MAG: AAA family ATPase [Candidatus Limiplasma sp.]|nr:AAA family ATPase [Candidatus Limiplasma sp.]